jgi:S-adenosyl-L-methionine hydrolase (adenosine-forming)
MPPAGLLHAVALSRLTPEALKRTQRFDLSHGVPAHDINAGRWMLQQSLPYLPPHGVMVCVVDPHVGKAEQTIALLARPGYQQLFVAPDNGLLEGLVAYLPDAERYALPLKHAQAYGWPYPNEAAEASAGATFHGRDIYTPLACHFLNAWAMGNSYSQSLEAFSPFQVEALATCPNAVPPYQEVSPGVFQCHIQYGDGFGNLITTLPHFKVPHEAGQALTLQHPVVGEATLPLYSCYTEGEGISVFAVRGSHGFVELASFASPCNLLLQVGDPLILAIEASINALGF